MAHIIINNQQLTIDNKTPTLLKALEDGFNTAADHRKSIGVDERILKDLRQATSVYDPKTRKAFCDKMEPDVFFPLGAMKARAQVSWMRDVVAGAIEKMWEAEPTPIPELPANVTAQIREGVFAEMSEVLKGGGVFNFEDIVKITNNLVDEQIDREYQEAQERSKRMSQLILDQWVEGGWLDTWAECITDLSRAPVCIAKGPVDVSRRTVTWSGNRLKESYEVQPIMYRVAPQNFYPMPDVGHDVNTGTGVYELATMSLAELHQAKELPSYNKEMIQQLIDANPNGWTKSNAIHADVAKVLKRASDDENHGDGNLGAGIFHTIKYYGKIQVKTLRADGHIQDIDDRLDDDQFVNIEAWIIKNVVIYLTVEPYPLGDRPFSVTPREFVAGSIWGGESLQSMISTPQRIINALVRQQILNMGYAAGPIGEAEATRFAGAPPQYVEPRKIYQVNSSTHGEKALRFTDIPANTEAYIRTITFYLNQSDSLSGIPGFIEGSPGVERNATLGHTQFYFGNASRGIDALLVLIDRFMIETMLVRFYYRNLMRIDDDSIKGDAKWKARGLSGVFQKQGKRDQSIAAIQLLAQIREVMPSYVTEESFLELVRPVFENIGLDIDQVLQDNAGNQAGESSPTSPEAAVEQVINTLDQTATAQPVVTSNAN